MCLQLLSAAAAMAPPTPLPTTPAAAAAQAATAAQRALATGKFDRLQITIVGDSVEDVDSPLPQHSLCAKLAEVLGNERATVHFCFDSAALANAWSESSAARELSSSGYVTHACSWLDAADEQFEAATACVATRGRRRGSSMVLVVVGPCNRAPSIRASPDAPKLERLQSLICTAQRHSRPVILANPQLEAMLLTRRIGTPIPPPMFLSDFEHCYFLAEAEAKAGFVQAVRRAGADTQWEVYRVVDAADDGEASAGLGAAARGSGSITRAGGWAGGAASPAVETLALACTYPFKPRAATLLTNAARRSRDARSGGGRRRAGRRGAVPGKPAHEVPFSAEDGWEWDGEIEWES